MECRQIRVFHSVAPAQTYILSRSPFSMQIFPINENSTASPLQFASVSLKSCIDLICNSSPEIFSDSQKDFSVYSLDPLESLASVASCSTSSQTISVACGRISAIRSSNGHAVVNGTLVKDRVGQEALQLVFVLCETAVIHKVPDPAAASRISAALARQTEENDRARRRKQKEKERRFIRPALKTEADRILKASGDSRVVQSGDPLGPWTQPKTSIHKSSSAQPGYPASAQRTFLTPHSSQVPSSSLQGFALAPQTLSPELLAILETAKSNPQVNKEALFRVISFIDSATKENAALTIADALRKLAPSQDPVGLPQAPQTPPQTPPAPNTLASPDDAVVVLDKENVNPSAFRRRVERSAEDVKYLAASMSWTTGYASTTPSLLPQQKVPLTSGLIQSLPTNTTLNNGPVPLPSTTRKRTLSEVLDDTRTSKRDQERNYALSSPPRSNRTTNLSPGFSKDQPIVIPDSPSMPRQGGQNTQSRIQLKMPYVVPDWARTQTAMRPRLSEEAQLMMKEAERRKQEEKLVKRMKWSEQRKLEPMHRTHSTPALFYSGVDESIASGLTLPSSTKNGTMAPPPLTVPDPLFPVIAAADTSISFPSSSLPRSPSPPLMRPLPPPCTPPRKPVTSSNLSPEEEFSLFTPRGMATPQRAPSVFENLRVSQSPSIRPRRHATPPPTSEPVAEDDSDSCQGYDSDEQDFLTQELNGALEETDISATSAIEQSEEGQTADTHNPNEDEQDESQSDEPFWLNLPPSSPPQQSSPMLQPVADQSLNDLDDFELPIASSDFDIENNATRTEQMGGTRNSEISFEADHNADSPDGQFDENALAAILEILADPDNANPLVADNPEDIFKDLGAVIGETRRGQYADTIHSNNFPSDITLNNPGFWSAVGSLLDQNSSAETAIEGSDPIKNLLSGCVL
ncbi:hypothetical protein J3R30DRAFT_3402371 [Lentinula aciculospora]|uniref:Ams2/SPT21 N-terminal domain-containing protein n=1 Tax=Lentinula aciculospora TaxID=153920 RepID=A0A9W9AJ32_9AGAR|nr:hypothetical protein J3R30DRAFT_3402371 [Lentinula aciculospora]